MVPLSSGLKKLEAVGFSKMLVPVSQTTQCEVSEDHNHNGLWILSRNSVKINIKVAHIFFVLLVI
jgi:hypothetical protein